MQEDGADYTLGRCWYTYYYFFDGSGFKEYAGKEMSEKEFSVKTGGEDLLAAIRNDGLNIRNILYRANGIININCSARQEAQNHGWMSTPGGTYFYYLELECNDGIWQVNGDWQEGNIKVANTPELAVYP